MNKNKADDILEDTPISSSKLSSSRERDAIGETKNELSTQSMNVESKPQQTQQNAQEDEWKKKYEEMERKYKEMMEMKN